MSFHWKEGDPITVTEIENTCSACPAQWGGRTEAGDWIYFRYRWGGLSISLWNRPDGGRDWLDIWHERAGDSFDGYMEYDELKQHVPDWITLPEQEGVEEGDTDADL